MNYLFLLSLFFQTMAFGYVLNKGPIFQKELGFYPSQKSLLAPYYFYYQQNTIAQRILNHQYKKEAEKSYERNGHYLKLSTPDRNEHDDSWKHTYPFSYNRDSFFYLSDQEKIFTNYGFCYGFAAALRKFDYFAIYKPKNDKDPIDVLLKKIDAIFQNKPQDINGFEDLTDLTFGYQYQDKTVEYYIRKHIVDQWAVNNVRNGVIWDYLGHYFEKREKRGLKHFYEFHQKVSRFIANGFQPLIFHFWGAATNIHVYRVIDITPIKKSSEDSEQEYTLTLYDYTSEVIVKRITPNLGKWHELVPGEELEMGNYANELKKYYHQNLTPRTSITNN